MPLKECFLPSRIMFEESTRQKSKCECRVALLFSPGVHCHFRPSFFSAIIRVLDLPLV